MYMFERMGYLICLDRTIRSKGCKVVPLLSAQLHINSEAIKEDPNRITGIKGTLKSTQFKILPGMADLRTSDCYTTIDLNNIPPGSILVFSCHPDPLTIPPQSLWERSQWAGIVQVISELDLYDLNMLLYRSAPEENDSSLPMGTYQLPGYGPLAFSGLQGFYSIILKSQDDPRSYSCLSENVKGGDWALDYLCNRLNRPGYLRLKELHTWLKELIQDIKSIKAELKPRLFVKLVCELWKLATDVALAKMNSSLPEKINIVKSLALTSIQLIGSVNSTGLHPAKPQIPCMSAGLPHFSTHHMRCWGRDVFIALPGLMLRTCRFEDAKTHFVAFAGCYFRGLIPNLLDSARRPRYNARDATWWFLHALKRYCKAVSKEKADDLLSTMIPLRFPNGIYVDFDDPTIFSRSIPLKEIVQDILESHAKGIEFKEWNAGPALDSVMRDEGFNIRIRLDPKTGLVFGGNRWNCGTWMDKMGESEKAGNRGIPSTPRDGAAIELIAALDSVLEWLIEDNLTGIDHVTLADGSLYTFVQWRRALKNNFESIFFIPKDPCDHNPNIDPTLVGRRGIYKDTFGATNLRGDYQLRPNMMVAMSLSPDLFNRENAIEALRLADRVLVGPLGMRTLDPEDPAYRPNYDNSDDSMDGQVARGANYHQGPEWVWLYGCHLQAMAKFGLINKANMLGRLNNHWNCLQSNDFAGLPELTNRDGSLCRDSCATQAWSSATILDALYYVQE